MEDDLGPEDYFDDTTRGRRRDVDEEDEFMETVLLVILVLAVTVLLYVRTRIIDRLRRGAAGEDEQRQQEREGVNWFN
jgi:SEL1 protein